MTHSSLESSESLDSSCFLGRRASLAALKDLSAFNQQQAQRWRCYHDWGVPATSRPTRRHELMTLNAIAFKARSAGNP
jgi:hypothetical protein